jgi:methyl-accepting chemotaxis protein
MRVAMAMNPQRDDAAVPQDPLAPPERSARELSFERHVPQPQAGPSMLRIRAALPVALGVILGAAIGAGSLHATGSAGLAAAATLALAAGFGFFSSRRADRDQSSLGELARAADDLQRGNRLRRIDVQRLGSFAALGHGFNASFDALAEVSQRVLRVLNRVRDLPDRIAATLAQIDSRASAQEEAVEESASLMANINSSIRDIDARVDKLSRTSQESAASILELDSSVDEVSRNAGALQESVENSTSSVHEMSANIRQVAVSAASVQRIAEQTAASMREMDRAVQQIDGHVTQAAQLTEQLGDGADKGSQAVSETIDDIEQIHSLTNDAKAALDTLVGRIGEISVLLTGIGEINDEANLLSLNAAIIAAQAGEQGKAFRVVANHVKVLARRTTASTKAIAQLLRAVEKESDGAMSSMSLGVEAIDQGVRRSRVAGRSLLAIRSSALESRELVTAIARASEEQRRTSSSVTQAAQETSSQVQQITTAMAEQDRAGEQVLKNSEAALELCRQVYHAIDEQRASGRYIREAISSVSDMIHHIKQSTGEHAQASEAVSQVVMRLLENARASAEHIPALNAMLGELRESAETIVPELSRFEIATDRS